MKFLIHILGRLLGKIIKWILYTQTKKDWYAKKGYTGNNDQERLESFLKAQRKPGGIFEKEFRGLDITRQKIETLDHRDRGQTIDSISMKPADISDDKLTHLVLFAGVERYYERDWRSLALQAQTGVAMHSFNHVGLCSSTGYVDHPQDMIKSGISVVEHLIGQRNINPQRIVLIGNCAGCSTMLGVAEYFKTKRNIIMRQISDNSFKSIKSFVIHRFPRTKHFQNLIKRLLDESEWHMKPGQGFYKITPYHFYMHRENDGEVAAEAKIHARIEKYKNTPIPHKHSTDDMLNFSNEDRQWLERYLEFKFKDGAKDKLRGEDVHNTQTYQIETVNHTDEGRALSQFEVIKKFIDISDKYLPNSKLDYTYNTIERSNAQQI